MITNPSGAVEAYDKMLRQGGSPGLEARDQSAADFSSM